MSGRYPGKFYKKRHLQTKYAADTVISLLLENLPAVRSAVDFGCGVGTWLSILQVNGVSDILGIDGDWVDRKYLVIPKECFLEADLCGFSGVGRRFDLAISLEAAEHLPASYAVEFVRLLTEASDYVLFSAAVPGQGGEHHVNERWPSYWKDLFESEGFTAFDLIRPSIWSDNKIPFWYRQNILFFCRKGCADESLGSKYAASGTSFPLDVVHPELYKQKLNRVE